MLYNSYANLCFSLVNVGYVLLILCPIENRKWVEVRFCHPYTI